MSLKEAASIVHSLLVIGKEQDAERLFIWMLQIFGIDDEVIEQRFAEMCDKGPKVLSY